MYFKDYRAGFLLMRDAAMVTTDLETIAATIGEANAFKLVLDQSSSFASLTNCF